VGRFIYTAAGFSVDFDDRTLAHLRLVIMNKLRRGESFMFNVELNDGSGRRSCWMHPAVPVHFHFFGTRRPALNRAWLSDLMASANGPNGLDVVPEPPDPAAAAPASGARKAP
jgi:hypothetical protein